MDNYRKIYYTTLEMLIERDYNMEKYVKNGKIAFEDDELHDKIIVTSPKGDKVSVFFFNEKMGVNEIKELFETLINEKVTHVIFITKNKLTSYAKKEMNNLGKNIEIEIFYNHEMVSNITKHVLVPKHELLTEEETVLFFKKIGKKIPHIKKSDKVCRYYNGKIDQVFRIYRKKELYYRIVV